MEYYHQESDRNLMGRLHINDSLRTQIFRKMVKIFQTNHVLSRVIRPTSWYVWDGSPQMKDDPFTQGGLPAIRMTPVAQPARPMTNVRFESPFLIRIEIGVPGLNMDDIINLWDAIHFSIFTGDGNKATLAALQALSNAVTPMGQNVIQLGLGTPGFTPITSSLPTEAIVADGDIWIQMMMPR